MNISVVVEQKPMNSSQDSYYVWDCSKKTVQQNPWNQPSQNGKFPAQNSSFSWNGQKSENSSFFGSRSFSSASSVSSGSSRNTVGSLLCLEGPGHQPKQSHWYSRGNIKVSLIGSTQSVNSSDAVKTSMTPKGSS